jgi:hypothetical protein
MVKPGQIQRALDLALEMPLIVPLRHPYRVEESWKRRGKSVAELVSCFDTLAEKFAPLRPCFMPVDSPRREEALQELSGELGVELSTDWAVVHGEAGTHSLALEDLSPSPPVVDLVARLAPLLSRFY